MNKQIWCWDIRGSHFDSCFLQIFPEISSLGYTQVFGDDGNIGICRRHFLFNTIKIFCTMSQEMSVLTEFFDLELRMFTRIPQSYLVNPKWTGNFRRGL